MDFFDIVHKLNTVHFERVRHARVFEPTGIKLKVRVFYVCKPAKHFYAQYEGNPCKTPKNVSFSFLLAYSVENIAMASNSSTTCNFWAAFLVSNSTNPVTDEEYVYLISSTNSHWKIEV